MSNVNLCTYYSIQILSGLFIPFNAFFSLSEELNRWFKSLDLLWCHSILIEVVYSKVTVPQRVPLTLQNSLNRPLDKIIPQHTHISADRNAQDQITHVIIVLTHTLCDLWVAVPEGLTGETLLPLLESGRKKQTDEWRNGETKRRSTACSAPLYMLMRLILMLTFSCKFGCTWHLYKKASWYYLGFWTRYHAFKLIFFEIKDYLHILICKYMVSICCKNILKSVSWSCFTRYIYLRSKIVLV